MGSTYKNRKFIESIGRDFFKELPKEPGIYCFFDAKDHLIYVGKAKSLRRRLNDYKNVNCSNSSKKVRKMLRMVGRISFEVLASEEEALIRENKLLREHRPPYNIVNTRPDTYYFIQLRERGMQLELRLGTKLEASDKKGDFLYGAFKGRQRVRESFAALHRVLWFIKYQDDALSWPSRLLREKLSYRFHIDFDEREDWLRLFKQFMKGSSGKLLDYLEALAEAQGFGSCFSDHILRNDRELLQEFYELGPHRNRQLSRLFKGGQIHIPQDEIDDLLVRQSFSN